jgi:hypothetical protein
LWWWWRLHTLQNRSPDLRPSEFIFQLDAIEYRTTKAIRSQSDCIVKRLRRVLLDDPFHVEGRRTCLDTIKEMQAILDSCLYGYDHRRQHPGQGLQVKPTPATADKWRKVNRS